jgi:hypothetical protein
MTETEDRSKPAAQDDAERLPPSEGAKRARDELLDELLSPSPRAARRATQTQTGLTPLDLLTEDIPAEQRLLISWLARRKQAPFEEISAFMAQHGIPAEQRAADARRHAGKRAAPSSAAGRRNMLSDRFSRHSAAHRRRFA